MCVSMGGGGSVPREREEREFPFLGRLFPSSCFRRLAVHYGKSGMIPTAYTKRQLLEGMGTTVLHCYIPYCRGFVID